jgi:hypothetical protein
LAVAGLSLRSISPEFLELFHGESCAIENSGQSARVQTAVKWHNYLRERVVSPQGDMAALLALDVEASTSKSTDNFISR